jgi:hypothetical protein
LVVHRDAAALVVFVLCVWGLREKWASENIYVTSTKRGLKVLKYTG